MALIKFIRGKQEQYAAALAKSGDTVNNSIFFVTDEHKIMVNGVQYGGADDAVFDGFIKDVDVEGNRLKFKKDVNGKWTDMSIKLIAPGDKSIVLGDITESDVTDGSTIKVNVKDVKDADGLKLGEDGLYVDLTETTKAITDEIAARTKADTAISGAVDTNTAAINTLKGEDTVEGSVKKTVKDAINGLDVTSVGGTGKVITTVSETDGKIAATAIDLTASAVAATAISASTDTVAVEGTTVAAQVASLGKAVKATQNAAATYSVKKVTSGLSENVKEAYQLVQTVNGKSTDIDVQIPIYKDQTLKSVELATEKPAEKEGAAATKGQFLKYTYILETGKESVVYVDVSQFLVESEFKNGLQVNGGEVSVKVDAASEFLTVSENGVNVSGVSDAIAKAVKVETDRATAAENKNASAITANANAITKLNGDEKTDGSVKKAVADAKAELLGGAATDYNTLGKLEGKIQALDDKATKAHTEVNAKAEGHVTVTVTDSTDKTHKVVTVNESDIASATALTAETNARKEADSGLTTNLNDEIDRAKKAESALTDSLNDEITNRKDAVSALTKSLNAEVTRAKEAEAKALTDAQAYTDNALIWLDAGTYFDLPSSTTK